MTWLVEYMNIWVTPTDLSRGGGPRSPATNQKNGTPIRGYGQGKSPQGPINCRTQYGTKARPTFFVLVNHATIRDTRLLGNLQLRRSIQFFKSLSRARHTKPNESNGPRNGLGPWQQRCGTSIFCSGPSGARMVSVGQRLWHIRIGYRHHELCTDISRRRNQFVAGSKEKKTNLPGRWVKHFGSASFVHVPLRVSCSSQHRWHPRFTISRRLAP